MWCEYYLQDNTFLKLRILDNFAIFLRAFFFSFCKFCNQINIDILSGDSCLLVEEPHAWTKLVLYRDLFPYSLVFSEDDFGPSDQPVGLKLYARHELECCLLNKG